jgi:ferredoxin-NADP reductase
LAARGDGLTVSHTLTRMQPPGWKGYARRIDRAMLAEVAWPKQQMPSIFVCGPTPLVENVATLLVDMGYEPAFIRTERFGPTGG